MTDQYDYWAKREQQERDSAVRASDTAARRIHMDMAERYSVLKGDEALRITVPVRG